MERGDAMAEEGLPSQEGCLGNGGAARRDMRANGQFLTSVAVACEARCRRCMSAGAGTGRATCIHGGREGRWSHSKPTKPPSSRPARREPASNHGGHLRCY
eukprot:5968306-Prymnesium_polylepis.2